MSEAEIVSALLALSPKKRAEIAGILLRSLELEDADEEVEAAWAEEIERRIDEIRRGEARLVPGDQAMRNIRRKLRHKRTTRRK